MNTSTTLTELQTSSSQANSTTAPLASEVPVWRRVLDEIWERRRIEGRRRLTAKEIEDWVAENRDDAGEAS